jgi:hypothetical protein
MDKRCYSQSRERTEDERSFDDEHERAVRYSSCGFRAKDRTPTLSSSRSASCHAYQGDTDHDVPRGPAALTMEASYARGNRARSPKSPPSRFLIGRCG